MKFMSVRTESIVDGRTARRERGRLAVLDALIDLLGETGASPTTTEIAERAGVSPATLFRYFDSADDLQHEATIRHFERNRELFDIASIAQGSLDERIDSLVAARLKLYDKIAPVARFGRSRAIEVPYLADGIRTVRRLHAKQIGEHFALELDQRPEAVAEDLIMSVAMLTSFESWDQQRRDFGRSDKRVRSSWVAALHDLLG